MSKSTPLFKDISKFSNVSDYLPIFNGILFIETFTIYLTLLGFYKSKYLEIWYTKYRLSAVMTDLIIVNIIIIITRFLYHYLFSTFSIIYFIGLAIVIQIIHDFLFYILITIVPKGHNAMIDTFKNYVKEAGKFAILGDSLVITTSCLGASLLANYNLNYNIITLFTTLYFIPYILYTK